MAIGCRGRTRGSADVLNVMDRSPRAGRLIGSTFALLAIPGRVFICAGRVPGLDPVERGVFGSSIQALDASEADGVGEFKRPALRSEVECR